MEPVDSDREEFFDDEQGPFEDGDEGEPRATNDNDQTQADGQVHTSTHPSRSIHDRTDKNENVGHMIPSRPSVPRAGEPARGTHRPVLPKIPPQATVKTNGDSSPTKVTRQSTVKTGVEASPRQVPRPSEDDADAHSSSTESSPADPLIRVEINEKQKPGQKTTRPIVKSRTEPSEAASSQRNRPRQQPTDGDDRPNQTSIEITVSDPSSGKRFAQSSLSPYLSSTPAFQCPPITQQHEHVGQLCEARWYSSNFCFARMYSVTLLEWQPNKSTIEPLIRKRPRRCLECSNSILFKRSSTSTSVALATTAWEVIVVS